NTGKRHLCARRAKRLSRGTFLVWPERECLPRRLDARRDLWQQRLDRAMHIVVAEIDESRSNLGVPLRENVVSLEVVCGEHFLDDRAYLSRYAGAGQHGCNAAELTEALQHRAFRALRLQLGFQALLIHRIQAPARKVSRTNTSRLSGAR